MKKIITAVLALALISAPARAAPAEDTVAVIAIAMTIGAMILLDSEDTPVSP